MAGSYATSSGLMGGADALQNFLAQRKMEEIAAQQAAAAAQQKQFENQVLAVKTQSGATKDYADAQRALRPDAGPAPEFKDVTTEGQGGTKVLRGFNVRTGTLGEPLGNVPADKVTKNIEPWTLKDGSQVMAYQDESGHLIDAATQHVVDPNTVLNRAQQPVDPLVARERQLNIERLQREAQQAQGGANAPDPGAAAGLHGDEYLKSLDPQQANRVKMIAEGTAPFPVSRSMTPQNQALTQQLLAQVAQYDPSFDTVNYNSRLKTRAAFTSGPEAKKVQAINQVIGHLKTLSDLTDQLGNTSYPLVNWGLNIAKQQTGQTGVTNFQTVAPRVAQELTRAWRGAGGSEADIQRDLETLSQNAAPQQIHGAISHIGELVQSALDSLGSQYEQGMGTKPIGMLSADSEAKLAAIQGKGTAASASGQPSEGEQRPIPGIDGGIAQFKGGKWIRIK